jgi:hypothetical protein
MRGGGGAGTAAGVGVAAVAETDRNAAATMRTAERAAGKACRCGMAYVIAHRDAPRKG